VRQCRGGAVKSFGRSHGELGFFCGEPGGGEGGGIARRALIRWSVRERSVRRKRGEEYRRGYSVVRKEGSRYTPRAWCSAVPKKKMKENLRI